MRGSGALFSLRKRMTSSLPPASENQHELPSVESVLEGILFASDEPRSARELAMVLHDVALRESPDSEQRFEKNVREVHDVLVRIAERYETSSLAVSLVEVAGGWEFRTRAELAPWLQPVVSRRRMKLGRAAMEVLAVVAYRQPCTRADVDDIRGVDSSSTLRSLVQLKLLRVIGRADDVGRPLVYGTSEAFLRLFTLDQLEDLPTLREFSELSEEHMLTLSELDEMRAELNNEADDASSSTPSESRLPDDPQRADNV